MTPFLHVTEVLGGLALFLFGLDRLSGGLRTVAGQRLRILLEWTTRRRLPGYTLGTALGFLLHSSGATVMMVGFLNAGLVGLGPLTPVLLGVNLGTTLNMQVLSLNLSAITFPAIALGMAAGFHGSEQVRAGGRALFGFGMLFLGMDIMGGGVEPYRDRLQPLLVGLDPESLSGTLLLLAASLLVTAILQSSGATIGMGFALVQGGVFTSLDQMFPVVLGAHVGTCMTAFLASLGGNRASRQLALAHLGFNLINVGMALALREPLLQMVKASSPDLVRQTANLHTGVMLAASLILLPLSARFAHLVRKLLPDLESGDAVSFLTPDAMGKVETALPASRRETARLARIARDSLVYARRGYLERNRALSSRVERNEDVFDTIKDTMIRYLRTLGRRPEVDRPELRRIDQWIHRVTQMERIGDHLHSLFAVAVEQRSEPGNLLFGRELTRELISLFDQTHDMLTALEQSCLEEPAPDSGIRRRRRRLQETTERARSLFTLKMDTAKVQPRVLFYYNAYLELFERLGRHIELADASEAP